MGSVQYNEKTLVFEYLTQNQTHISGKKGVLEEFVLNQVLIWVQESQISKLLYYTNIIKNKREKQENSSY